MGWKTIRGHRYLYRSTREGRRIRTTYVGTEETAALAAFFDGDERDERAAERRRLATEREESAAEERAVSCWFAGVQALAEASMVAAGFHKHKGQWRKRRTMGEAMAVQYAAPSEAAREVVERALRGDESCLAELKALLADGERGRQLTNAVGSSAEWLRQTIGRQAGSRNILVREGLLRKIAEVQAELEGPAPTPIERLLAERAAVCWFLVNWHERTYEDASGMTLAQADFHQRKIDRAHGRFLSAVRTLAQARKLAVPVLLVNIAENQINLAAVRPS